MKRKFVFTLSLLLTFFLTVPAAGAASSISYGIPNINVLLDGKRLAFPDVWPQADANQRVLVPIRVVSENLGAKVDYANNKITISQDGKTIVLIIGSKTATVDGKAVTFDSAAVVKNNRTLVPLRFVSEALGQSVEWNGVDQYVWIGKKDVPVVDDVIKGAAVEEYTYLFSKHPNVLTSSGVPRTEVWDIKESQLPIMIPYGFKKDPSKPDSWDSIFYGFSIVSIEGKKYIKIHYSGTSHIRIRLLTDDGIPRGRAKNPNLSAKDTDGSYIEYYPLLNSGDELYGDPDWNKLQISDVKYIQLLYDSKNYVFIQNPYYKS
ncbi:copper amine oxidase N-terminal domain-containing protein [Cohnella massiliensis]|uniref:copper amine oxidase N-terminal domain-containing protein n=1 Tax=Cohnella massiliensis TaxID=1816691 RepID=UPI0009B9A680|nr:copper amine oxidase N-terminal domain-containing protein [Cohnella massiliensis]